MSKSSDKRRSAFHLPFLLFRLGLSLLVLIIFGVAVYQAQNYFLGSETVNSSLRSNFWTILSSDQTNQLLQDLLSWKLPESREDVKAILGQAIKSQGGKLPFLLPSALPAVSPPLFLRVAVVADSHNDNENLRKALALAKSLQVEAVVGLGDYTEVGTTEELEEAKQVFTEARLPFYTTAGDHDLWDCRNRKLPPTCNFNPIFGTPYQSFSIKGIRFVVFFNGDNYDGVDPFQMGWLEEELDRIKREPPLKLFVLTAEPLYHPSSDHVMGKVNPNLKEQARQLIQLFQKSGVTEVLAGDTHQFSRYLEPGSSLKMTTVGAVTKERNLQTPRLSLIDVFEDGSYNVQEVEIR